jgi:hypothetical protein
MGEILYFVRVTKDVKSPYFNEGSKVQEFKKQNQLIRNNQYK